jgi:hypothetical protein
MFGPAQATLAAGVCNAGRSGLPTHLMVSVLYLKPGKE